jgi:hypothetical protein
MYCTTLLSIQNGFLHLPAAQYYWYWTILIKYWSFESCNTPTSHEYDVPRLRHWCEWESSGTLHYLWKLELLSLPRVATSFVNAARAILLHR